MTAELMLSLERDGAEVDVSATAEVTFERDELERVCIAVHSVKLKADGLVLTKAEMRIAKDEFAALGWEALKH